MVLTHPKPQHLFMQHINGLQSLIIIHILFSHNDYCNGILREIKSCTIDNIVQCPDLKVKYVAVSYSLNGPMATLISRLVRKTVPPGKSNTKKKRFSAQKDEDLQQNANQISNSSFMVNGKGKGKEIQILESGSTGSSEPSLASSWTPDDSEDDFGHVEEERVRGIESVKLRDAAGIKIWQKEIWGLRL